MRTCVNVYDYLPEALGATEGIEICRVTEDADDYCTFPRPADVSILVARQGTVNDMLACYPNVRFLQLLNAGYEKVNLQLLRDRSILFANARSVYCHTIAEDVLLKILVLARNYPRHFCDQQNHFWPDDAQLPNENMDVGGKTLCILGAGFIGREIALRANALGMTVVGYDPYREAQEGFSRIERDEGALPALLGASDFVVTSLPVTGQTRNIINARTLSMMKQSAFFINVARGDIVDEDALCAALNEDRLRGASLDVAKEEPLSANSPLWTAKNLFITPHRAAYGDQMRRRMSALIGRNLRHFVANEPLEDRVL